MPNLDLLIYLTTSIAETFHFENSHHQNFEISVRDGRVSLRWQIRREFPINLEEVMTADGNMRDSGTAYLVCLIAVYRSNICV